MRQVRSGMEQAKESLGGELKGRILTLEPQDFQRCQPGSYTKKQHLN